MSQRADYSAASTRSLKRIRYIPEFDGLRGLAAIFVVVVHLYMTIIPGSGQLPTEIPGTFVFMDLFFVLSGFLITALLLRSQLKNGRVGIGRFYLRRAMRLLPALYVLLAAHGAYAWFKGPPNYPAGVERSTLLSAAFYGLNFRMDNLLSPVALGLTQLWSLGVEEQFYVLWPLVVMIVIPVQRKLTTVVAVLGSSILAVAVYRYFLWDDSMATNTGWLRLYTHTDTRADSLLVGALLAYLWVHDVLPPVRAIKLAAWASIPILAWFLVDVELTDSFAYKGGFTLMAILWASVILACVSSDWPGRRLLRIPTLRGLGQVSYGIYLWHVPVQFAVIENGASWTVPIKVVVSLVMTGVFVTLSWCLVERPFLQWKDRIERRRPEPASTNRANDSPGIKAQISQPS